MSKNQTRQKLDNAIAGLTVAKALNEDVLADFPEVYYKFMNELENQLKTLKEFKRNL